MSGYIFNTLCFKCITLVILVFTSTYAKRTMKFYELTTVVNVCINFHFEKGPKHQQSLRTRSK